MASLGLLLLTGCGESGREGPTDADLQSVQGTPIIRGEAAAPASNSVTGTAPNRMTPPVADQEADADGFLLLGFDTLSAFKYEVYEYYAEGVSGRPLLKSDDVIPEPIKTLDGRKVSIRGFVLPLRTRKGRVTELLLLRDQGTCCFGPQAQINHFIRINHPKGSEIEQTLPYRVRGVIRVGETYVQGYLTGIYNLEAESIERSLE